MSVLVHIVSMNSVQALFLSFPFIQLGSCNCWMLFYMCSIIWDSYHALVKAAFK